ncbi:hypothetical protein BS47DRAFT_1363247 [Hydnum rufescens UP504]|uniref:Uncharacterized protein n=1 Tax=Hydnum rufescens UP504 TaxID=1448309 RepID=A0A9P6AV26_9AGAM|nr:hypothetical protein BS47DRAFT_1363247 [Hydnum rufescens UP504]
MITRPQRGPPNDNVPHEETNHTPALAGVWLSEPMTPPSKHTRTAMDPPNETCESSNPQHDDQALYQVRTIRPWYKPRTTPTSEQRSELRPAKQHTRPSDGQPPRTEPSITTNTNEDPRCNPHPNDNMPTNDDAPNKDMGQCQNWYEPHTRDGGCVVLYKVLA